jgi:hypothetical protein
MAAKTTCPITRETFDAKARPVLARIGGTDVLLEARQFSTGSLGFHANPKVAVEIDGVRVVCQANLMLTVVGSKELPR